MTITTRTAKGTTLTTVELDGNFTDLDGRVTANTEATVANAAAIVANTAVLGPRTGCTYTGGLLTGYTQNGATHVITYSAVGPGGSSVPVTDVGGGKTHTYSYSGGFFTGEVVA